MPEGIQQYIKLENRLVLLPFWTRPTIAFVPARSATQAKAIGTFSSGTVLSGWTRFQS